MSIKAMRVEKLDGIDVDELIRWQREARELLQEVEWSGRITTGIRNCLICERRKLDGHAPDCTLAKLLREVSI